MLVELSRFKIRRGKEGRVDEWPRMLNSRAAEAKVTLRRERRRRLSIVGPGDRRICSLHLPALARLCLSLASVGF
jgi:hypothetical protein